MLKLHVNEGKRTVVAIVERNGLDAVEYVARRLGIKELEYTGDGSGEIKPMYLLPMLHMHKLVRDTTNKGVAKCNTEDKFDVGTGEGLAIHKAYENNDKSFKRAIKRWQLSMLKTIYQIRPDTFHDALDSFNKWETKQ